MSKTIKLKEPSVMRTYDQDGFRKRAACICVNDDESKVLLVTSRKDVSLWIVPGGGVEPNEVDAVAAVREVREEAGVCGTLGRCLGVFENAERGHRTSVFVLVVTEELDEWDESRTFGRQRQWFTAEAAVAALHKPLQSNYVKLLLPPEHHYHAQPPHPHVLPILQQPSDCGTTDSTRGSACRTQSLTDDGAADSVASGDGGCNSQMSLHPIDDAGNMSISGGKLDSNTVVLDPLCSQESPVVASTMTPASISTG